jgi:hypothetical protein
VKTIFISSFALHDGHSVIDDDRYFSFMFAAKQDFVYYTSNYSYTRIIGKYPNAYQRIRSYELSKIGVNYADRVVFVGFTEKGVVRFLLTNILRNPRIILIATNNFSAARIRKYSWQLRFFLWLVNPFLIRIVLHTDYEKQLLSAIAPLLTKKLLLKKHHLMTPRFDFVESSKKDLIVSYFGPIKFDKPIEPVIDLIRADTGKKFLYRLYSVSIGEIEKVLPDLSNFLNVEVIEKRKDERDYIQKFSESSLVFLTHSHEFEGKLSGNLCDCFSMRIPFISSAIEPVVFYQALYGDLGFIVDYRDTSWAFKFLNDFDCSKYSLMIRNLDSLGLEHSAKAIDADLSVCFSG